MKLSVNWLRELVDLPEDVEALAERMTLLGLEVESSEAFTIGFPGVFVGHVLDAQPHPDADRLRVCRVSVGGEELDIVCGAPNVRTGLTVAVATVGAVLPGDFKIKKSKIRGQVSMGMICSERELGLGEGHEGIMELDADLEVGRAFDELHGYRDHVIEIEVTPNRPDWLSHIGVARELAAHYGGPVRLPQLGAAVPTVEEDAGWRVEIQDPHGCPLFTARRVDGVTVGESPRWMQHRLKAIGQRPINAVVDASNYVLHETGHPNHCFDRDKLNGQTVFLRRAAAGEAFRTLDDVDRELQDHHLVVADAKGPIALGGVMGGANSEVDASTRDLLLEVAVFDPQVVRQGRRSVGLNTDASYRFERGVDPTGAEWVSRRLAGLIVEVTGGTASDVLVRARGEAPATPARFFVRAPQVKRVLGVDLSPDRMKEILGNLEIETELARENGVEGVRVTQPSFRRDLLEEIDAIEELARHHGFDALPGRERAPMAVPARRRESDALRERLRRTLAAKGYHEVLGTSFQPETDVDALALPDDDPRRQVVRVLNPVVQGEAQLRSHAWPEMARIVERNRHRGWTDPLRFFQLARTYVARPDDALPAEPESLVLAWNGPAWPLHPDQPTREVDMQDVVGEIDALLGDLGIEASRKAAKPERFHRAGSTVEWRVTGREEPVATAAEFAPAARKALDLDEPVLFAELPLETLLAARPGHRPFEAYSAYPPVRRDLSLVAPREVAWASIDARVREVAGDVLERCELFDVYEGEGLPAGTVALGLRLSLRSMKGTLKDARVDALLAKLLDDLKSTHQIRLRSEA